MEYIHDNKPPLSSGKASIFVDMVFWHPSERDTRPLVTFLERHQLGERSQTVEWLTKFTVRLAMYRHKYFPDLTAEEWKEAAQDLIGFVNDVAGIYHPKKVEYDTRAFSVGLAQKVPHETKPLASLADALPAHEKPVWWTLKL